MPLAKRLISAWERHGAAGFLKLLGKNISHYLRELFSGRLFRVSENQSSDFDQAHGTDTESVREVGSLDIKSDNVKHAVRYQPSPSNLARQIIHGLAIAHDYYTFIDFGAGKGRVLMLAAELPFKAVVGIEFSRELCDVANDNIDKIPANMRVASNIRCQYVDATAFPLPDTPLVCYFYNPFNAIIMQTVADRLLVSLTKNPREVYIVYLHPEHRAIFDESGRWENIDESEFHIVYRARS